MIIKDKAMNNPFKQAPTGSLFLLLAVFVLVFSKFFNTTNVIMTTDANISSSNISTANVLRYMAPHWSNWALLGGPGGSETHIAGLLKAVLPGILWNNVFYGLACLIGALVFLWSFGKQLNRWAALCGALAAFWLGNNFTLIYPGHGLKPYVALFFVCTVLSAGIPSWRGGILWGGFTGLMFAQQPDVALFFALFAGAHLIFQLWRREGFKPLRWLPVLVPAAIVSLLFAAGPLLSGYNLNVKDTTQVQSETPQEKWDYVTQWSWPPEESMAFIAPGYTGWRTGEPDGPYYGRMGRSTGWEKTRQGYMNFQLESAYIGLIPFAFALFALYSCRRSPHRPEIIFWGLATLVALLLGFGKNFPLYSLFYKLPVVNAIRNPAKFNQIFQIALAILTAYGIDALLQGRKQGSPANEPAPERRFFLIACAALGLLVLWTLIRSSTQASGISTFTMQGWPAEMARVIVSNQIRALWHASFMATLIVIVFAIFTLKPFAGLRTKANWIAAAIALVIAGDALMLSRHYVQSMPRSYIQANELTRFLKDNLGTQRVALLTQESLYNIWLTYLLPFNHIPTFNFAQMPRMPVDYKNFLSAASKDPLRMWRFSAVKYLLGPSSFEKQFPPNQVRKVFAYSLEAAPNNEFYLLPNPKGDHAVFELMASLPRYVLLADTGTQTDEQAIARIADSSQPLLRGQGSTGSVELINYRPGKVVLKTNADVPTTLRVAERWDPDWKAIVDGIEAKVNRIDYLCQGVSLTPGKHEVKLIYSPSCLFLYLQIAGVVTLLIAAFLPRNKHPTL